MAPIIYSPGASPLPWRSYTPPNRDADVIENEHCIEDVHVRADEHSSVPRSHAPSPLLFRLSPKPPQPLTPSPRPLSRPSPKASLRSVSYASRGMCVNAARR